MRRSGGQCPGALKIFKKWRVDLIEDLIAGPAEFDD
jgi:hypothetical protein